MSRLFLLVLILVSGIVFSQNKNKTKFLNVVQILTQIQPKPSVEDWVLVHNVYGKDQIIKYTGKKDYLPQFKGLNLSPHENSFYYIAYWEKESWQYITDLAGLMVFVGNIDNVFEAAILSVYEGYIIDLEFKDYAANYQSTAPFFIIEAGKITQEKCPLSKSGFEIWVDKKTGKVTQAKEIGNYFEIYDKTCINNPHYLAVEQQKLATQQKLEEQKKIQKEKTEKMENKIRKTQRKNNRY